MLDVGGASGAHYLEAVRRYLQLQAVVYDLPGALAVPREKIAVGFREMRRMPIASSGANGLLVGYKP